MSTSATSPLIRFGLVHDFPGWEKAEPMITALIEEHNFKTVLEVGAGANPTLGVQYVRRYGLHYIASDRDESELAKADPAYSGRKLDLLGGEVPADLVGQCDMVFSRMVNEHVQDGAQYHANIYRLLSPGGLAVHAYSTLYNLPYLANYLLPSRLSDALLHWIGRRDWHQHGKFPAYYSWTLGPTRKSVRRFQRLGYEVLSYDGFFGHLYYRARFPLLDRIEAWKSRVLLQLEVPLFCAYASVILRKPATIHPSMERKPS